MLAFSVIISICADDRADWFNLALWSIIDQTIKPAEIIVTIDGPVPDNLYRVIYKHEKEHPEIIFRSVVTDERVGRGSLLATAVLRSNYTLVAIMDADDYSYRNRFESQLSAFEKYPQVDMIGGWVDEVDSNSGIKYGRREVPEFHSDIIQFFKWRNPINQMTVMFKKSAVLAAGNYKNHRYFEDMWLWARMFQYGLKAYNIQSPLVKANAGVRMFCRRRGIQYARSEVSLLLKMHQIGFFNKQRTLLNILFRVPARLLPVSVLSPVFKRALRSS